MRFISLRHITIVFLFLIIGNSCKKFVEIAPPINQLNSEVIFTTDDKTAIGAITGIYSQMMTNPSQFSDCFTTFLAGMSSDELTYYTPSFRDEFLNNEITIVNHKQIVASFWLPAYNYIYSANLCIDGLTKSKVVTPSLKTQLLGEAKFIRAFCYFYLVNLFGNVPLETSSDYKTNQNIARTDRQLVYNQIIADLIDAIDELPADYPAGEKSRPSKYAAYAMLARVYLYNEKWSDAEKMADTVINSSVYHLDADLNAVFLKNSDEAIWQLQPVVPNANTIEAKNIIPQTDAAMPTYLLTSTLINAFEPEDKRKMDWVTSRDFDGQTLYYPTKYKAFLPGAPVTEYYMVLRLAEQYLIRAEARAQQDKIKDANDDLNIIRSRAGLSDTTLSVKDSLLLAIEHEREVELFAEWGHRWFDLIRTGRANTLLGKIKPTWKSTAILWPIPEEEINANPKLVQNPGYQ